MMIGVWIGGGSSSAATVAGLTIPPGSLNNLSVVFSATIRGQESCHINENPHGFDSCALQTSLEGGTENFEAQWTMNVSAVVPVTSHDDLADPAIGTGSGRETSVAISSAGTIVDGHNALDGCSYVSPSATEVQATSTPAPTPATVTDLHALRSASTVRDFSLTLLPGGQDSVNTTVDFDKNDCWAGGPFSETLISNFAGGSLIAAAAPAAHDDHGNPVYTGWTLDPDGTWQKDGTGPVAEKTLDTTFDEKLPAPGDHASGTIHEQLSLETPCGTATQDRESARGQAPPKACLPPKANAGGSYTVNRAAKVIFNGSGSKPSTGHKITSYHWQMAANGTCGKSTPLDVTSSSPTLGPFTMLCGLSVTLTITDSGGQTASNSTNVTVNPRAGPAWTVPVTHHQDLTGKDWRTPTGSIMGRNVVGCDEKAPPDDANPYCPHDLTATGSHNNNGYLIATVDDSGPFQGDTYIASSTLTIVRLALFNPIYLQNGPIEAGATMNFYDYNVAHRNGTAAASLLASIKAHEKGHTNAMAAVARTNAGNAGRRSNPWSPRILTG